MAELSLAKINEIKNMVINEAAYPYLPGRDNGPADTYRHVLLAAELTRQYGELIARIILEEHEWEGWWTGQFLESEEMDRANNEIGVQVVRGVTSALDSS